MTSVLAVYTREKCVGYCGAQCIQAMQPSQLKLKNGRYLRNAPCYCICGGANHAMGYPRAIKNRIRGVGFDKKTLEEFAERMGFEAKDLVVVDRLEHPDIDKARAFALAMFDPPAPGPLFEWADEQEQLELHWQQQLEEEEQFRCDEITT